jgi:uncharacterized protein YprB with RNaseH-like and TPR domain
LVTRIRNEIPQLQQYLRGGQYDRLIQNATNLALWRLYANLREDPRGICYFDIETTGINAQTAVVTTIATWDRAEFKIFVRGENLEEFPAYIARYAAVGTFFGNSFDIPFLLERFSGQIKFPVIWFDLYYLFKALQVPAGLKKLERLLGIERQGIQDLDGAAAVKLWELYEDSRDPEVLDTLLAYNAADVASLDYLMTLVYNLNTRILNAPFRLIPVEPLPAITRWQPSESIVARVRQFAAPRPTSLVSKRHPNSAYAKLMAIPEERRLDRIIALNRKTGPLKRLAPSQTILDDYLCTAPGTVLPRPPEE